MSKLDITPFLSTDPLRPLLNAVFYDGEYANASNSIVAVRWLDSTAPSPKAPNLKALFKAKTNSHFFDRIDYDVWLNALPKVVSEYDCAVCEGHGQVTWQFDIYNKEDDCPECNGKGSVKDSSKIIPQKTPYKIGDALFSQEVIAKVIHVMEFFAIYTCDVFEMAPFKLRSISIDKYEIGIMPLENYADQFGNPY